MSESSVLDMFVGLIYLGGSSSALLIDVPMISHVVHLDSWQTSMGFLEIAVVSSLTWQMIISFCERNE
jgi:hypothetical protein